MPENQQEHLKKLLTEQENLSNGWLDYWQQWSHMGTWQFWALVAMIVVPLVSLYFLIDKKKALLIGFFGFNIHVWFTYADIVGARFGMWSYPFQAIPFLTVSFGLDASLVPVAFMLVYQWTIHSKRNSYLYLGALSAFFSFALKPFLVSIHLFQLHKWATYFHLFIFYILIFSISLWITKIFLFFEEKKG